MLHSIENGEDLEILNELVSLQIEVQALRLQDNLGKQNFHEELKEVFERVIKSIEDTSEDVTKTITEISIQNNKALNTLNDKLLEILNDRGVITTYLSSLSYKITNPNHTRHFKLGKNPDSYRVNDFLIKITIADTLFDNLLTFCDTNNYFELKGEILKMIIDRNFNLHLVELPDKKLMFDFAKEMYFDEKSLGNKSTR